jgi:hypothetical protein
VTYNWHDAVGIVGVALILYAYLMLQLDRMEEDELRFSLLNAVGALALVVSLSQDFNLSAMVMEAAWLVISLIGIGRWYRLRRRFAGTRNPEA